MSERTEEKDYEALHKSQESANELVRQRLLKVLCDTEDFLGGLGEDFAFVASSRARVLSSALRGSTSSDLFKSLNSSFQSISTPPL